MSLAEVRREKHLRWRRSELIKKKPLFDRWLIFNSNPVELAAYRITRFVRRHLLSPPINISSEEWMEIPPLFRIRLKVDTDSFYPHPTLDDRPKKKKKRTTPSSTVEPPTLNPSTSIGSFDEEMQRVLEESLAQQSTSTEKNGENGSIIGSLVTNITSYFTPSEAAPVGVDPESTVEKSVSEEPMSEEELLSAAIEASLQPKPSAPELPPPITTATSGDGMELVSQLMSDSLVADQPPTPTKPKPMVFGFDLQLIRHQLDESIEFAGLHYFLTLPQKMYIYRLWQKIDPSSTVGVHFRQDLDYYKSESIDLAKKGKFMYAA